MRAISRAYSTHTRKFDKTFRLRSFETYVYWRTISTDLLYVAPTRKQSVTDTARRYRIRQRVGSVPHAGQLATDSRWTRRTTSVHGSSG